jgi:hypothetical protein
VARAITMTVINDIILMNRFFFFERKYFLATKTDRFIDSGLESLKIHISKYFTKKPTNEYQ